MERNAKHATVRTSIFDEDRFTYAVNQRVMTVDSFPGVITARQAGPMPGSESYTVHLDDGMGGGEYRIDDITPLADEIAATARRYSDVPLVCDKCGCTATTSMSGGKDGHTMLCPDCQAARKTAGYGDVSQKITEGNLTFEVWQNYDRDTYSERFPLFTWKGEYVCTVTSWSDEGATKGYGSEIIDGYGDSPEAAALADARRQLSTFMKASRTVVNGGERTAARANLPLAAPGSLHVASDDYPELEDILWTRPDHVEAMPTGVRTLGSTTATTIKDTINDPNSSWLYRHVTGPAIDRMNDALPGTYRVDDITQVRGDLNWCRFRRDSHCLSGETEVMTIDGALPIKTLAGSTATILDGVGNWTEAPIRSFGEQQLFEVVVERWGVQRSIFATAEHRWFITVAGKRHEALTVPIDGVEPVHARPKHSISDVDLDAMTAFCEQCGESVSVIVRHGKPRCGRFVVQGNRASEKRAFGGVRYRALKAGDTLAVTTPRKYKHGWKVDPVGVMAGFVYGDGWTTQTGGSADGPRGASSAVRLWGDKDAALLPYFSQYTSNRNYEAGEMCAVSGVQFGSLPGFFNRLPELNESPHYLYGWLAGYFAADGSVGVSGQVSMSSANRSALEHVIKVCNRLNIAVGEIKKNDVKPSDLVPTERSVVYTLHLFAQSLLDDFFLVPAHRSRFQERDERSAPLAWRVVDVRETDRFEEVFCATVSTTASFALPGYILTGNCFFPKALDEQATRVAGYDVWVPVDRGPCKRHLAQAQKDCEIAEPGPKSGEANWKPDATKRWDQGGQRVSVRTAGVDSVRGAQLQPGDVIAVSHRVFDSADSKDGLSLVPPSSSTPVPYSGRITSYKGMQLSSPYTVTVDWATVASVEKGARSTVRVTLVDGRTFSVSSNSAGRKMSLVRKSALSQEGLISVAENVMENFGLVGRTFHHGEGHVKRESTDSKTGAWTNVRDKGVEIRRSGGVHIIANTGNTVTAEVHGDHNIYVTTITRVPGSKEQGLWQCSCPWSTYAWGRSEPWKSLEGRQCSHAYALLMEMQAQEMFGGHIEESRDTPSWRTTEPVMSSLSAQDALLSLGNIADSLIVASGIMGDDDGRLRMEAALDATRSVADRIADAGSRQSSSRQAGAFPAKVRGRVTQVEVTPAGVLADGEPVSAGEVLYPTWDPSAGLAYFGAKTADWNWQLPSAPVVKPTDGVDGRFTVTVENYVVGWLWKTDRSWDAFMVDPSSATGEVVGRGFTSKAAALSSLVSSLENSYKRFERIKARDDAHADEMRQLFGAKTAVSDGATRQFGSYTMRYHTEDQGERKPRHVIEAFDGGTKVGELNWYGTTGTVHHIGVEDGFLRQGVATAMWEWGQEMSPKPKHSADRTTQGDAWARSVGGPVPRSASVKTATDYDEIDAMWNANYWSGQADVARRQQAAQQRLYDMKGQEVTVVKGRKIPIGTKGIVFYVGEGQWGWRVGFNDASGNAVWTDVSNVKLTSELSSAASLHIAGVGVIEDVSSIDDLPTDGFGYAGLIIKSIDSGRVLLTQRSPFHGDDEKSFGKWEFPGGHLDDGETPFEGALREFTEETGLALPENWEVRGYCPSGKYLGIVLAVPHEAWTVDASLLDFETMGLGWFDLDDVEGAGFVRSEVQSTDFEMVREAAAPFTDRCAVCGKPIQSNSGKWKHSRPQPDGSPNDHAAVPAQPGKTAAGPIGPGPLPLGMRICPDCGGEGHLLIEPLFDGNVGDTDTCNLCAGKGYIRDTRPGVEIDFERRHIEGELTPEARGVARNEARYDSENGEGTLAILHDEPQPALPEALGSDAPFVPGDPRLSHLAPAGGEGDGNEDIAAAAQAILKSALKTFSPAEQQRIIDEGAHMSLGASNTDRLDLAGTFYETLEHEDDPIGFW
jgi:8-oxo-dGTP pyrophosphatase MutT (NUDIX family)